MRPNASMQNQGPEQAARAGLATAVGASLQILLVEDSEMDAALSRILISRAGLVPEPAITRADSLGSARAALAEKTFDCVLLDLGLPDSSGLQGLRELRQTDPNVPVVLLTGLDDDRIAIEAMRAGAQDYVMKEGLNSKSLVRAIRHSIQRQQMMARLNSERSQASFQASHDTLTGMANRRLLEERATGFIAAAARSQLQVSVLLLDLNGFKQINDQLGHQTGDDVLKIVATRIRRSIRDEDLACRLGGDEFVLLFAPEEDGADTGALMAQRLKEIIGAPMAVGTHTLTVGTSIGAAHFPRDGSTVEDILAVADQRMYADKSACTSPTPAAAGLASP